MYEFRNFSYREIKVNLEQIFPNLNRKAIEKQFSKFKSQNQHETILNVTTELWNKEYENILDEQGFHDQEYSVFSGHCHQCTPALGLALKSLNFKVSYLECFRIREHFPQTGLIEQVPPEEESNLETIDEFCSIGRIPYCCLEVIINNKSYYLTGKHLKSIEGKPQALLEPICYSSSDNSIFMHQKDSKKSGIYLETVIPEKNPDNINFSRRIVWMKQTFKDPSPEYFATFLRMELL